MMNLINEIDLSVLNKAQFKYLVGQFEKTYRSTELICDFMEQNNVFANESGYVLDVATGIGSQVMYMIKRFPNYYFYGFDVNEKFVKLGQDIFKLKNVTRGELFIDNIYQMDPSKYNNIDVITCLQTLSWLPNYENVLKNLASIKANYMVFSALFYDGSLDYKIEVSDISGRSIPINEVAHYNVISLDRMRAILSCYNYEIKYVPFLIDIDLPKPKDAILGTYTKKIEDGTRLQISGGMMMPWYFVLATKMK